jgi:hypothetical protein
VRPGARRIAAVSSHANVTVSSFENKDGRIATQLLNQGNSNVEVNVQITGLKSGASIKPYLTNNDNDLEPLASIAVAKGGSFHAEVPAWSMVTYLAV